MNIVCICILKKYVQVSPPAEVEFEDWGDRQIALKRGASSIRFGADVLGPRLL